MYQNQQSGTNNGGMVPEAKQALNNMKFEIANELGINLKQGYNGDMPSQPSGRLYRRLHGQAPDRAGRTRHERQPEVSF